MSFTATGVDRRLVAGAPDPRGWVAVCAVDDIDDGHGRIAVLKGTEVALVRDGDRVVALGNVCPHRGGQIGDGTVRGGAIICPLHQWDFDLTSGISAYNPADSLPVYGCRVVEGQVLLDAESVPPGAPRPDAYLGQWTRRGAHDRGMKTVQGMAGGGAAIVEAMGSLRLDPEEHVDHSLPSLSSVVFLPAQLARSPLLGDEPVDTTVRLGTRAARPLQLAIPLVVSHMSFGALSAEAKTSLAAGARRMGTVICSGEGGMLPAERAAAGQYVMEMASGYHGWGPDAIAAADGVEIKMGQGAKPGLGGLLPGDKVTAEIAAVRGIAAGTPSHSPSRFPDISTPAEMAERLQWIRSINPGIPIGIKLASGHIVDDAAVALDAGADYLVIDGFGGGTGAAPVHVKDHVGIPSWVALHRVRRWLDDRGIDDVQLVVTGGFRTPDEVAKALAIGADAVALATASLMAIGCQQYRACHRGTCPVGIASQREELRARFEPDVASERMVNFLRATTDQVVDYCRITGRRSVGELSRADLAALTPAVASLLDLDLM